MKRFLYKSTSRMSGLRITRTIQTILPSLDVYVAPTYMAYLAECSHATTREALSVISEIMRPRFTEWELLQVRESIRQDIAQYRADKEQYLLEMLRHTAFAGQGMGRSICCPDYNVNRIYPEDLARYALNHHVGSNTVLVGTGPHGDLCQAAYSTLGSLQRRPLSIITREESIYVGGRRLEAGDGDYAVYGEAFDATAFGGGQSSHAQAIIAQIAGSYDRRLRAPGQGLSSAITKILQSIPGGPPPSLISLKCFSIADRPGLFGFYGTSNGSCHVIAETIKHVIHEIFAHITPATIRRAKLHLKHLSEHRLSQRNGYIHAIYSLHPHTVLQTEDEAPATMQDALRRVFSSRPTVYGSGNLAGMPGVFL